MATSGRGSEYSSKVTGFSTETMARSPTAPTNSDVSRRMQPEWAPVTDGICTASPSSSSDCASTEASGPPLECHSSTVSPRPAICEMVPEGGHAYYLATV